MLIPGTNVPDNAINRVSLWLHAFQGLGDEVSVHKSEADFTENTRRLLEECDVTNLTAEDVVAAIQYAAKSLVGVGGVDLLKTGILDLEHFARSAWSDGVRTGIALKAGKYGLSVEEMASQ